MKPAVVGAVLIAGLGIAVGLIFLFAPLGTSCTVTAIAPAPGVIAAPGVEECESQSVVQMQPVWPMPLLAIIVWSLAPSVTAIGLIRRLRGQTPGTGWIIAGLIAEGTVLVSFGAAPLFVPVVLLPLVVMTALGVRSSRPRSST